MRLKEIRINAGLTQQEVSEKLNCSKSLYSRYENEFRGIDSKTLIELSHIFNVSIDYILENDLYAIESKNQIISSQTLSDIEQSILKQYHSADTFDQIAILRILGIREKTELKESNLVN